MTTAQAELIIESEIDPPPAPPPSPVGRMLIGAYQSVLHSELVDYLEVVDYPRQGPAQTRAVLACLVPDIRKGDVIQAWGSLQATNRLAYCVEFTGRLWLAPTPAQWNSGKTMCYESGYNVVPQIFDFPGDNTPTPGTFPGMHHGMHMKHGQYVAPEDMGDQWVVYSVYAGGSSYTTLGDQLRIDKYGNIDVLHFR